MMDGDAPRVEVRPALLDCEPLLTAMLPDYLRELGVGVSDYPYLALYWVEADRYPYLLLADGRVAGFALVRNLDLPERFEMAEFYVIPALRRRGVGRSAVRALFARHPGEWALSVLASNPRALAFWLSLVPRGTLPRLVDEPGQWPHLRLSFRVAPAAG
ncbi:GNAT family N-acetyltransferase [Pseudomonas panipatensis]|uniref:Acetyltransferase (GNAT) family protein n=2 Tax=Pseudomonas panipatensis TaxID=428992 RepID=A0A1G8FNQ0_9PSED|nr:GNAT family N-acetyltransferase [Pseudomonas panipatensis]SDH83701.1 Acetyltransferase (GNAT) family protein [Pseudomonas panipatensis]SMP52833.1 Acetyltransferase (GNAT) family protein [Pseudomonas panipatensis]